MTVFITGGSKSGKSSLAQDTALALAQGGKRYYVATMIPSDGEDRERIRLHLLDRAGMGFETLECGRDILSCLDHADRSAAFLVDSVTALLLNELFLDPTGAEMDLSAAERCADALVRFAGTVGNAVFVSDSIFSDAQRYDEITETYRRGLARIDRSLARVCDTVVEVCAGNRNVLKGELPL